jgi:Na+/H+-dicarboxylate symporter
MIKAAPKEKPEEKPKLSLTAQIAIALCLGAIVGLMLNSWAGETVIRFFAGGLFDMVGSMFTNALKMLVVPLVTFSLISGVAGIGDVRKLGRVGGSSLVIYLFTTAVAIAIGLLIASVFNPGEGFVLDGIDLSNVHTTDQAPSAWSVLASIVPTNPIHAFSEGNMLQIIFYVIMIAVAALMLGDISSPFIQACEYMNELMMKIVEIVMYAAPYGVFCLIAKTFAMEGFDLFVPVLSYVGTLVTVLAFHLFVTLMLIFYLGTGLSPVMFLRKMRSAHLFAFSTASSSATIPVTLQCATHRIGANNSVASFVIPFGATINMDGTAIMQGVATVFFANVYGVDLSMADYATVISMSVLASVGTAGVPGVGLIMLTMVLDQVGLPIEGVAIILGVDRILDMMRTVVNISGDAVVTTIVAKREGLLDIDVFNDPRAGEVASEGFEIDPEAEKRLQEAAQPQHDHH